MTKWFSEETAPAGRHFPWYGETAEEKESEAPRLLVDNGEFVEIGFLVLGLATGERRWYTDENKPMEKEPKAWAPLPERAAL